LKIYKFSLRRSRSTFIKDFSFFINHWSYSINYRFISNSFSTKTTSLSRIQTFEWSIKSTQ